MASDDKGRRSPTGALSCGYLALEVGGARGGSFPIDSKRARAPHPSGASRGSPGCPQGPVSLPCPCRAGSSRLRRPPERGPPRPGELGCGSDDDATVMTVMTPACLQPVLSATRVPQPRDGLTPTAPASRPGWRTSWDLLGSHPPPVPPVRPSLWQRMS